eukprot:g19323.t1
MLRPSAPRFMKKFKHGNAAIAKYELDQLHDSIVELAETRPFTARSLLAEIRKLNATSAEEEQHLSEAAGRDSDSGSGKRRNKKGRDRREGDRASKGRDRRSNDEGKKDGKQRMSSEGPSASSSSKGGEDVESTESHADKVRRTIIKLNSGIPQAAYEHKGKTTTFAYLSDLDKARVLVLTGAEGAEEVAKSTTGKTKFFANLLPQQKYKGLITWQQEREESAKKSAQNEDSGEEDGSGESSLKKISNADLRKLFNANAAPMVAFGFADNFLMILFGSSIETQFGVYVSTMAAAGLGNLCSNLVGMGLAEYIEHASEKIGVAAPKLTYAQRQTTAARVTSSAGTMAGITVGCLLGLAPLNFMSGNDD